MQNIWESINDYPMIFSSKLQKKLSIIIKIQSHLFIAKTSTTEKKFFSALIKREYWSLESLRIWKAMKHFVWPLWVKSTGLHCTSLLKMSFSPSRCHLSSKSWVWVFEDRRSSWQEFVFSGSGLLSKQLVQYKDWV